MDQDTIDRLLGRDAADEIRAAVASGEYESPEAAIREAVDRWRGNRDARLARLRAELREGLDDIEAGRVHEATPEFWDELRQETVRRRGG